MTQIIYNLTAGLTGATDTYHGNTDFTLQIQIINFWIYTAALDA